MKTADLFKNNRSAKKLNESMEKLFGTKLDLASFDTPKLEDARNKLRTQIHTARQTSGFNETIENEALTKAQFMHDAIVAELMDRAEHIVSTVEEAPADVYEMEYMFTGDDGETGDGTITYEVVDGQVDPASLRGYCEGDGNNKLDDDWCTEMVQPGGYEHEEALAYAQEDYNEQSAGNESVEEGAMSEIAAELSQVADDEDYDTLYKLLSDDGVVGEYLQDKIQDITGETGLHPKDDFEKIEMMLMDIVQQEFGGQNDDEGGETDDNYAMASAGFGSDEDYESVQYKEAYDMDQVRKDAADGVKKSIDRQSDDRIAKLKSDKNKGFMAKVGDKIIGGAKGAAKGFMGKEDITMERDTDPEEDDYHFSRGGFGARRRTDDRNVKRISIEKNESIEQTGDDMRNLREGEIQQASAIVTAKTMVDRVGRWIEELSGMENDTLLTLGDSIRDEMGQEAAKNFISACAPAIQQALENLKSTREALSTSVRALTGEEQSPEMLGAVDPGIGMDDEMGDAEPDAMNAEPEADEFGASDAAVGGLESPGREQRESIDRGNSLLRVLAG